MKSGPMTEEEREKLTRIDERTLRIITDIVEIKSIIDQKVVTHDQFTPVKLFVYGVVSLMCVSIVGGLIALVIR